MRPREFEELVASRYRADGYTTELSAYSSDWGVDLVAVKGAERLAVQAKMYGGSTRRVTRAMVMQLYGAAAYFDCTGAVIATDGELLPDAQVVAGKLGVQILRVDTTSKCLEPEAGAASGEFDDIWERYVMPLAGRTLHRPDSSSNTIVSVDWSGLVRLTSHDNRQRIPIEVFRFAVERVLEIGSITRDEINQEFSGRASSGVVLVLAQVPLFRVGGRPLTVSLAAR